MKMKENSLSYSDNDGADIQLDPAIQSFIAPNVKGSVEVDFDGYGTLHVLERGADGGLLSDSYLVKQEDNEAFNVKDEYTNEDKLEHMMKVNMHLRRAIKLRNVLIIGFGIFLVLFCILLKLTLQRFM